MTEPVTRGQHADAAYKPGALVLFGGSLVPTCAGLSAVML